MLFLIAYISSVVLINFAFSTAPHLDVIWSAWGGLVFILRDMVQTRFGHGAIIAMLAAPALTASTNSSTSEISAAPERLNVFFIKINLSWPRVCGLLWCPVGAEHRVCQR